MTSNAPDAGIPLLTEIIPVTEDVAAPRSPAPVSETAMARLAEGDEMPRLADEQWARLEREIRERILQQLRARVDKLIEQRVRESLADMLQVAVASIALELRASIHQGLSDTVAEAIAAELSALRT